MRLSNEEWVSPASLSMAAGAQPFLAWLTCTAESLALAAAQAEASAAAYETAFAMMVPPAEVAANRARLAALTATNTFGQNVSAIAANEARYGEMWAQDASAMYGYAAASAAAGRLNPLTSPSPTTNPAGTSNQAAAVGQAAASADAAESLAAPVTGATALDLLVAFDRNEFWWMDTFHHNRATYWDYSVGQIGGSNGPDDDAGEAVASSVAPGVAAARMSAHSVTPAGVGGPRPQAGLGAASSVGRLSVPASWATAAPALTAGTASGGTGWTVPEEDRPIEATPLAPGMVADADGARFRAGPRYGVRPLVMPKQRLC